MAGCHATIEVVADTFRSGRLKRRLIDVWQTNDLDEHMALIKRQVNRSLDDPETRQLAVKITSGKPDAWTQHQGAKWPVVRAWGEYFVLPDVQKGARPCAMRDEWCEIVTIWNFVVANVRYVYDPSAYDLFCTAEYTLRAGGGDCDDMTILLASLLKSVGFEGVAARVVSTTGQKWEHVYALVGIPKDPPKRWFALDPTVAGVVPGWEYKNVRDTRDFYL